MCECIPRDCSHFSCGLHWSYSRLFQEGSIGQSNLWFWIHFCDLGSARWKVHLVGGLLVGRFEKQEELIYCNINVKSVGFTPVFIAFLWEREWCWNSWKISQVSIMLRQCSVALKHWLLCHAHFHKVFRCSVYPKSCPNCIAFRSSRSSYTS